MNLKSILLVCLIALLTIVSGCSSSSEAKTMTAGAAVIENAPATSDQTSASTAKGTASIKEVHIQAFNFGFTQDPVTIKKGDHVRLIFTSTSGTHGVMIPDLGLSTKAFSAGEEQVLEFTATNAGTFNYFCDVPCGKGHRDMQGQLVVQE